MKTALLSFKDLTRTLDDEGRRLVVSGQVETGQVLYVQGPSGSGKSTLLRILGRLLTASGGEAWLQGRSWKDIPAPQWRLKVQYLSQKPVVFDGTVEDNLLMPFRFKLLSQRPSPSPGQIKDYLERLKLPASLLEQSAKTLSGGEAARMALIRALLLEPEVLLLDEPTAYLDEDNRQHLLTLLKYWVAEKSRAIVMVSHNEQDLLVFPKHNSLFIG
jgi:putative ABC transport system ATP-binding protein